MPYPFNDENTDAGVAASERNIASSENDVAASERNMTASEQEVTASEGGVPFRPADLVASPNPESERRSSVLAELERLEEVDSQRSAADAQREAEGAGKAADAGERDLSAYE